MAAPPPFLLVLEPPATGANLGRKIAGLSMPLRLALSAQGAGAEAIVLADGLGWDTRRELADERLTIPVVTAAERAARFPGRPAIVVPANLVVHRGLFAAAAERLDGDRPLLEHPVPFDPPFGFAPIVVVDATTARAAESALLRSLRKPQDGWTSTHLNRHVSLFLTRQLVKTPLRPNQVSVGILGIGLLGAVLAARGDYASLVAGAALFQAQSILDGCDGEMSRVTFRGSRTGEWLDTIGDDLTNYGFFGGAAWGLYRTSGSPLYLALGAITIACGLVGSGIEYAYLVRIGSGDLLKYPLGVGKAPGGSGAKSGVARIGDAIAPLFKRDTFVLLTLVGAALGLLGPFLAVFAAGAVGVLVAILKAELRMARERRVPKPSSAG